MPIWACYDTLALISHLPMINISIPGRTSIMLTELAKALRFDFIPMNDWVRDWADDSIGYADSPLSITMQRNGYDACSILLNISPFIVAFIVLMLMQLFAKCADCTYVSIVRKEAQPNGRGLVRTLTLTQKMQNCMARFLMVTQLEFFICLFINFKAVSTAQNDPFSVSFGYLNF